MRTNSLLSVLPLVIVATVGSRSEPAPKDPCTLLKPAEVQALSPREQIGPGVSSTVSAALNSFACEYKWGKGGNAVGGLYSLQVIITEESKAYPGTDHELIKEGLVSLTVTERNTSTISGVGDGAIYQSNAAIRAETTALVKGWMLQVVLEGPDAATRKDQVIGLLKAAAGRL
jgi:hypothetical protein